MTSGNSNPRIWLFAAAALIAAAGGLWLAQQTRSEGAPVADQAQLREGPLLRLPRPKPLADFALHDHAGRAFSRSGLEGEWTLVFFGFSNCPHICPDTLFQLSRAVDQLEGELRPERVPGIVFIGVDPERDTPEALQRYRERFDNAIETVSGSDAQLRALAAQFGVHYVVPEHEPGEWYNVDHTTSVFLLDPRARWAGLLSPPHDAEAMAGALQRFLGGLPSNYAGG